MFVSGIGCAGRFSYYMDTYGMHGIHGRGAGAGDRPGRRARRPLDLGRDRRRRRAVDRRQPPDPRAAPQRAGEDPALQQPDLRPHQGPGVADLRARQGHEVDAVRLDRRAVQPGLAGARRRGDLRRPHGRHRQGAPDRDAARRRRARGRRAGRDLPELPRLQRRRLRRPARQEGRTRSTRSGSSTASRSSSTAARARSCATADGSCGSRTPATASRSSTTRTRDDPRLAFALSRLACVPERARRRSASSAPSSGRSHGAGSRAAARNRRRRRAELDALLHAGDTWTVA